MYIIDKVHVYVHICIPTVLYTVYTDACTQFFTVATAMYTVVGKITLIEWQPLGTTYKILR
jgi:hypothetical protein